MNLFILSLLPIECAEYMIDKHVHKILLEAVQMLCTALRLLSETDHPVYKISHKNHPVSIWCRTSRENFIWTLDLVDALHEEWRYRHGHTKVHKSYLIANYIRQHIPEVFPSQGLTPFALAMPNEYKVDDPVESYRNYYRQDKARMASWKKRSPPEWFYKSDKC
jgi:hypothetical protein